MVRQDAEQRTVALAYDTAHRVQSLINENGERFEFIYDAADRVIEERRVGGTRVTIDYDANGWPVVVTHHPGIGDDLNALASAKVLMPATWAQTPISTAAVRPTTRVAAIGRRCREATHASR